MDPFLSDPLTLADSPFGQGEEEARTDEDEDEEVPAIMASDAVGRLLDWK